MEQVRRAIIVVFRAGENCGGFANQVIRACVKTVFLSVQEAADTLARPCEQVNQYVWLFLERLALGARLIAPPLALRRHLMRRDALGISLGFR